MKFLEEEFPEICNSCGVRSNVWLVQFDARDRENPWRIHEKFMGPWCEKCISEMSLLFSIEVEDVSLVEIEGIVFLERIKGPDYITKPLEEAIDILQRCGFS